MNMDSTSKRIPYLDYAKGLLIILVVIHHIPQLAKSITGMEIELFEDVKSLNFLYAIYFMQAFFFISGYCSNFNKNFCQFLANNVKSLLIPGVLLPWLMTWILNVLHLDFHPSSYLRLNIVHLIEYGSWCWFLPALFVARLCYWVIHKYSKSTVILLLGCLVLLLLGCLLNTLDLFPNYWMHRHALSMVIFIGLGQLCKHRELPTLYYGFLGLGFLFLTFCFRFCHWPYCWITNAYHVSLAQIPLYLLFGITGTSLILWISKQIKSSSLLETLGRNSLVIYVFQFEIIRFLLSRIQGVIIDANYYVDFCIFVLVLVATIAISLLLSKLLNTKYLKFFLGKF